MNIKAGVRTDGEGGEYAVVEIGQAYITIHSSKLYPNTVNVELDGDYTVDEELSLRVHLNDVLVLDTMAGDPPELHFVRPEVADF